MGKEEELVKSLNQAIEYKNGDSSNVSISYVDRSEVVSDRDVLIFIFRLVLGMTSVFGISFFFLYLLFGL
jgi:hypothetical protein